MAEQLCGLFDSGRAYEYSRESTYTVCLVGGDASVCMVSPTAALRVRYVVCGSWDPLALLGPVLGPWVSLLMYDDLGTGYSCRRVWSLGRSSVLPYSA